jgi:hypothetical protein
MSCWIAGEDPDIRGLVAPYLLSVAKRKLLAKRVRGER